MNLSISLPDSKYVQFPEWYHVFEEEKKVRSSNPIHSPFISEPLQLRDVNLTKSRQESQEMIFQNTVNITRT